MEGGWEAVKEAVDQVINALRQVWPIKLPTGKFAMGQARVQNLLHVVAAAVAAYVQSQLRGVDVWVRPFAGEPLTDPVSDDFECLNKQCANDLHNPVCFIFKLAHL